MKVELAAMHEAGHSVMQWFVGREVLSLSMIVRETEAIDPNSHCPQPKSFELLSEIRRWLLMLYAGRTATQLQWPGCTHDKKDFSYACIGLNAHFKTMVSSDLSGNWAVIDPKQNELLQSAICVCEEIIAHQLVRRAIDAIGTLVIKTVPPDDGTIHLTSNEIVRICETIVTNEFRLNNQWTPWIAGN